MYRKDANRFIVRDVAKRLDELKSQFEWADWRLAVVSSRSQHPEWYQHHENLFRDVEPLLREAGIDMTVRDLPFHFVGNERPD
ncbi:hypothetical protein [Sphingobium xenophagum]|uniref:hypothetical protein n=1 Tax=Sphingobium xenophagum TaxID=121428 RepID=UPI00241F6831|nr:hypothetical protein [Sphingobium xenophagum]